MRVGRSCPANSDGDADRRPIRIGMALRHHDVATFKAKRLTANFRQTEVDPAKHAIRLDKIPRSLLRGSRESANQQQRQQQYCYQSCIKSVRFSHKNSSSLVNDSMRYTY